MRSAVIVCFHH